MLLHPYGQAVNNAHEESITNCATKNALLVLVHQLQSPPESRTVQDGEHVVGVVWKKLYKTLR